MDNTIYVVNQSTQVTDLEVQAMVAACAKQIAQHVAPSHFVTPAPVLFLSKTATPPAKQARIVAVMNKLDDPSALGYHTEDGAEHIWGVVGTDAVMSQGAKALTGPYAVSTILSHEVCEMYCVAPETRVLTDDLRWVAIGDIQVGDPLAAFDESTNGPGTRRMWRRATALSTQVIKRPCYDLVFEDGTAVRASSEHRWLVTNGTGQRWSTTEELRVATYGPDSRGRPRVGRAPSRVLKPLQTWKESATRTYEAGFLAAALEGEGCLSHYDCRGDKFGTATRLIFAQRENVMLDRYRQFLKESGYRYTESLGDTGMQVYVSHRDDVLRLLGTVRPQRLLDKLNLDTLGSVTSAHHNAVRLIEKQSVGEQEVVALQTSTGTYIAEGLASHNCDPFCSMWADNGHGVLIAFEIGDPVQSDHYTIDGVDVSNFVTGPWFNPMASRSSKFDYMGKLKKPFSMSKGGYWVQLTEGQTTQKFGAEVPEWLRELKQNDHTRTSRKTRLAP